MKRYFALDCRGEYHAEIDPESQKAAVRSWACSKCHRLLPGRKLKEVRLAHRAMGSQPFMVSFALSVGFFRRSFLEVVCAGEIDRHFEWANVLGPNGKPYRDWIIAVGHHRIIVRGSDLPSHSYCPQCGTLRYLTRGGFFLYPEPPPNIDVFDETPGRLVVTHPVLQRVQQHKWPKLTVFELGVAPKPLDKLGILPLRRLPSNAND